MGMLAAIWNGTHNTAARNYPRDLLYAATKLTSDQGVVYSFDGRLVYIQRKDIPTNIINAVTDYKVAHGCLALWLREQRLARLLLFMPHRKFIFIQQKNTFWHRWQVRKLFNGALPRFKI